MINYFLEKINFCPFFCPLKQEGILRQSLFRELHAENLEKTPSWILVIFYKSKRIFILKMELCIVYMHKQMGKQFYDRYKAWM